MKFWSVINVSNSTFGRRKRDYVRDPVKVLIHLKIRNWTFVKFWTTCDIMGKFKSKLCIGNSFV